MRFSGKVANAALAPGVLVLGAIALWFVLNRVGGAYVFESGSGYEALSPAANELIARAYEDIDRRRLLDLHVHVIATGTSCRECFVHPDFLSNLNPLKHMRFRVYASAAGINDFEQADEQYMQRLTGLAGQIRGHGRYVILAFDRFFNPDGSLNLARSEFYVSNDYVLGLAAARPDLFVAAASVHPRRADALLELTRVRNAGVRIIKWLPNAMGIDPADPRNGPYYDRMRQLGLVLLSHAGDEAAVESDQTQGFGNPLLLRSALDHGVTVVIAHCASLGRGRDLDRADTPLVSNFDLFLRLMQEPRYKGHVFGEISAMLQFNRLGQDLHDSPVARVLLDSELQKRLVNGSDYPLPAINIVVRTGMIRDAGFITDAERETLNEIYRYNPLLFDFVLKRTLRHPENANARLAASIFMVPNSWEMAPNP